MPATIAARMNSSELVGKERHLRDEDDRRRWHDDAVGDDATLEVGRGEHDEHHGHERCDHGAGAQGMARERDPGEYRRDASRPATGDEGAGLVRSHQPRCRMTDGGDGRVSPSARPFEALLFRVGRACSIAP